MEVNAYAATICCRLYHPTSLIRTEGRNL
jgi:hypothetical protein